MNTYKITNITNLAHKRDIKFNSPINIEYIDNRMKKVATIKAGNTMFLTVQSLPLSVHRLRIKKMITISEISPTELIKKVEADKSKKKPIKKVEKVLVATEPTFKPVKKITTTTKKKIVTK